MYKWTSGRPDIQYLAIPTEIANGASWYWEVSIPHRILAYVSQTTLEIEIFFPSAIQNSSLHNLKLYFSNFSNKVKGVLKKNPNKLNQYVTKNFKAGVGFFAYIIYKEMWHNVYGTSVPSKSVLTFPCQAWYEYSDILFVI